MEGHCTLCDDTGYDSHGRSCPCVLGRIYGWIDSRAGRDGPRDLVYRPLPALEPTREEMRRHYERLAEDWDGEVPARRPAEDDAELVYQVTVGMGW
jgi:hypothetical protein